MKLKNQYRLTDFLITFIIWICSLTLLAFFKFQNIDEVYIAKIYEYKGVTKYNIFLVCLALGVSFGVLFGVLNSFVYPKLIKQASFLKSFLFRVFGFLVVFIVSYVMVVLGYSNYVFGELNFSGEVVNSSVKSLFISAVIINSFSDFMLLVRKNIGPSYFNYLIVGRYIRPKEEERIFMFLDLKSSTTIAEKIGHVKYSLMLQECFKVLSSILLDYDAEIYQFVGDEAVITWRCRDNFNNEKCIMLFYHFINSLKEKENHFELNYGCVPKFKASLHTGKVTMAMVGDIKTEIVFHGDVLNTAARIQSLCNVYNCSLLLSSSFHAELSSSDKFITEKIQNINLPGKSMKQTIYKVALINS